MKRRTKHITNLIRKAISEVDPHAEVILFGSRARGNEKPDSDWDILILVDYVVDLNIEDNFRDRLYDLELETGEPISFFIYSREEWNTRQKVTPFYENVTREGVIL